jgi:hypothetical protein
VPAQTRPCAAVRVFYRCICIGAIFVAGYGYVTSRPGFEWFLSLAPLSAVCAGDISPANAIRTWREERQNKGGRSKRR